MKTPPKIAAPQPVPVYEVAPPETPALVAPPVLPVGPDTRTEIDKALDAIQPNRPGVKLNTVDKNGKPIRPAKQVAEV